MAANNIYIQVDFNSANAQANVNALNQSIANTGPAADKSSKQASSGINSIGISIQNVNREFAQLTTAIAGLGIAKAISGMVMLAAEMGRAEKAQNAFAGSAAKANEIFEQVRALAAQSPFKFKDLEETAQRLLVLGVNAKNVTYVLKEVTDQVARMGGTVHEVNTIVNLFGRMIQKDFVGAMDLLRALPAQGVPVIKALGDALSKEMGRAFDAEQVKEAIKSGVLDPMQTIRVMLEAMHQKGDASAFSDDAARAFKNLGDTIEATIAKLFGPDGFGPALVKLAEHIQNILAPLGGLVDWLMKLSPATKEVIVNVTAAAAAFAVFGTALSIVSSLSGPLMGLVASISKFTIALALANPEMTAFVILLTAMGVAAYKFIPDFEKFVDGMVGGLVNGVTDTFKGLSDAGKKFFADMLKPPVPIETGSLRRIQDAFDKLAAEQQKLADSAQKTLLEALSSPVEAVRMKYSELFRELNREIEKNLLDDQGDKLRSILGGAQAAEMAGAQYKENRKELEEISRYQVERTKANADVQAAYIEAQNRQDLRGKVQAIDQVAQLRVEAAQQVSKIEQDNLQNQFEGFKTMALEYRKQFEAAGIDVDDMVEEHRTEMVRRQGMVEQKQFDEAQKARLEGWKKANDAIIEDQKRVYDALKDQFGQLFDVFINRTKSLTAALGDFFKKMVLGEAREMFASHLGSIATQAAGYGTPEEGVARGGQGIIGTLLRRGMPPRAPLAPPELRQLPAAVTGIKYDTTASTLDRGVATFEVATSGYDVATMRFAEAVETFAGVAGSGGGGGGIRLASDRVPAGVAQAFENASASTGVPMSLLRAVAKTESGFNPAAIGPPTRYGRALGLMQLMPGTAQGLGVTDPFDAGQNAMGGAQYLGQMLRKYNGDVPAALAAYNMGPAGYDRAMKAGRALPLETQQYVQRITGLMRSAPAQPVAPAAQAAAAGAPPEVIAAASSTGDMTQELAGLPQRGGFDAFSGLPAQGTSWVEPNFGVGGGDITSGPSVAELAALPSHPSTLPMMGALAQSAIAKPGQLSNMKELFGIGAGPSGLGHTSFGSIAGSPGVAGLASMAGAAAISTGLARRNAPMTVAGGALAGVGAASMLGFAPLGGALLGAGAGLFAAGIQRGGASGLGMDVAGGALSGAMLGLRFGGPMGALIGGAIGAGVGAIAGTIRLFVHTESERIRAGIKQVYGVDISDRNVIKSIQQIVDQKYGGSVTVGIRSQEVQEIVRLYALSTGQAANLPRPMYNATIAQSQSGLALQPVYQGGVQVQNPYTGATTYQYQTAVTQAQGLMANGGVNNGGIASNSVFLQLNPQQANDLFTGRVVQAVQQNPSAIASANAAGTRAGDSRVTQAGNMLEPLTSLS